MSDVSWEHVYSADNVELHLGMTVYCLYEGDWRQFEVWDIFGDVICMIDEKLPQDSHIEKMNTEVFVYPTYWGMT